MLVRDRKVKCDLGPVVWSLTSPLPLDRVTQPAYLVIIPTLHHVSAAGARVKPANSVIADGSGKTAGEEEEEDVVDDGRNGTSKRSRLSMPNDTPTLTPLPTYAQPQMGAPPAYNPSYPTAPYSSGMNSLDQQRQGFANSVGKEAEEHSVAILQKQERFSGSDGINILIDAARPRRRPCQSGELQRTHP